MKAERTIDDLDALSVKASYESGESLKKIAARERVNHSTIWRLLRKLGVQIRRAWYRSHEFAGPISCHWRGGRFKTRNSYVVRWTPEGRQFEHRLVMEQALGRKLSGREVVHHRDGNPSNNEISNLQLFSSSGDHVSFHLALRSEEIRRNGTQVCSRCGCSKSLQDFGKRVSNPGVGLGLSSWCKACVSTYQKARRAASKRVAIALLAILGLTVNSYGYLGYQSNRFLPFLVPTAFVDNGFQWGITNGGQDNVLLSNGTVFAVEPALAGIDANVRAAWTLLGGRAVTNKKVAIISTGVTAHSDLPSLLPGVTVNFQTITAGQTDTGAGAGEGTAVAGIIAGVGSKTVDDGRICGIAPGAPILPISCPANQPSHSNAWNYALTNGAKILVLPWGYTSDWDNGSMRLLCQRSLDSNCIVVQAACDCGFYYGSISETNSLDFPGSLYPTYPNIIAATVLAYDNTVPTNAATGRYMVAAPARRTVSTGRPSYSQYVYVNGTSFAAPTVAGAAALIWAYHPTESAVQICGRIRNNVDYFTDYTAGRLNVYRAMCAECPVIRPAFQMSISPAPALRIGGEGLVVVERSADLQHWEDWQTVTAPIDLPITAAGDAMFFRLKK